MKTIPQKYREGEIIDLVAEHFTGCPPLEGNKAVALEDERADGVVLVAAHQAGTARVWTGFIARQANHGFVGQQAPVRNDEDEKVPEHKRDQVEKAEGDEAGENNEGEQENDGQNEGNGAGQEEDELLKLIHSIAQGRDEIVMETIGVEMANDLRERLNSRMNDLAESVDAKLAEIAENGLATRTVIVVNDVPVLDLGDDQVVHANLADVTALVKSGAKNVMLVGPAGCGKTTLARQLSQVLGHSRFAALSCSPGMSEAKVLGRVGMPTEKNETGYLETAIIAAFRDGGTILFDEMDNADASMMVSFNAMTDGGFATLPTGETVPRHPDTVIIAACNTFGHGADRMYVGRNQLDAATLDRFVGATIEMDYDHDLERKLVPEKEIRELVWNLRKHSRKHALRRVVSTRALTAARRLKLGLRISDVDVLRRLTLGWSQQDRSAVGVS